MALALSVAACSSSSKGAPSAPKPQILAVNAHLGPVATATMHSGSGSSDATELSGPGNGPISVDAVDVGAVCPAILMGTDEVPVALCTRIIDLRPVVLLLDPTSGAVLTSLELKKGGLFGGVYAYVDNTDRLVLVEGDSNLAWISHTQLDGRWRLQIDATTSLAEVIRPGDTVTSLAPDFGGGVWFATEAGTIGFAKSGSVKSVSVAERVANSISTSPEGVAVATEEALYMFSANSDGEPEQLWRLEYDRGPARKPGQLSWGTGSTPTFFGPGDGNEYLAIIDNADPEVHLIVVRAKGPKAGEILCSPTVFMSGGPGSENSPIGWGRSVVAASTYGYEYPRLPDGAGVSKPDKAEFVGGLTRVDVSDDAKSCDVVWDSNLRSMAVPHLSTADDQIVTISQPELGGSYSYAVVDFDSGITTAEIDLGEAARDPIQLAGTIGPSRVLWQGTVGTVLRISPASLDRDSTASQ